MRTLSSLIDNNRAWAARMLERDSQFFRRLTATQSPQFLWIGCADSRVPANEIVDLLPGELFVHRNVANLVSHTDLNCLSVLQFAVDELRVKHVIVCGHYGCGGVLAVLRDRRMGLIDNWLHEVKRVRDEYADQLAALPTEAARVDRLCELNVIEQVRHVCQTPIMQDAWKRAQSVAVHGWIYALDDGLLRDLGMTIDDPRALAETYTAARAHIGRHGAR